MQRTSDTRRNTLKSVGAKVTEDMYARIVCAAGHTKPGVWVRQLIEAHLERGPYEQKLMEEFWALRFIVLNGLPQLAPENDRPAMAARINSLNQQAEQRKADKAAALLKGTR